GRFEQGFRRGTECECTLRGCGFPSRIHTPILRLDSKSQYPNSIVIHRYSDKRAIQNRMKLG
ncbi:hypothetical protein ABZ319_25420, partial [Nocardia sp. NPDC005978]|uniref:hypothetical protein n=1 Tax=Nocardia sp. NPDC005978 TaxID=3156725 RepID=UPI0033A95478